MGKRHREDGPAIINFERSTEWYHDGVLHREDGPAIESGNINMWYNYGMLHRFNGPAIDYKLEPSMNAWYLFGKMYERKKYYKVRNIMYKFISRLKSRLRGRLLDILKKVGVNKNIARCVCNFVY